MSDQDFDKAFVFTIGVEGVVSDNPNDSGGFTVYGISSKWFPDVTAKIKEMLDANQKVAAMQVAKQFYEANFWLQHSCDVLPYPVNIFYFDSIINEGQAAGLSHLQTAIHFYLDSPNTLVGMDTPQAIAGFLRNVPVEPYTLMACTARTDHYLHLVDDIPNDRGFFRGWCNRVAKFRKTFMSKIYQSEAA